MKIKNPYILGVAFCMIAIFIYSCRKDFSTAEEVNPKVEWAKNYFTQTLLPEEGNIVDPHVYIKDLVRANRMAQAKDNIKIPIWQKAMEGKTPLFDLVEVPLKYTTKVTPMLAIKGSGNFSSTIDNEVVQASFDRLVIFKDKRGNIDQRIVSFVPTKEYLARHKGDISHNRINKLDSDFDGLLVYRKWDGSFLFGLYMRNGKAVQKVSFQRPKMQVEKTAFREQECHDEILYEIFQVCYYEGDSLIPFYCDPPYSEEVGTYPVCVDTDPCQDPANAYLVECGGDGPPPEGGGGGPGEPEQNCSAVETSIEGEETAEDFSSSVLESFATTRKKEYQWKYLKSLLWYYVSVEEGVHKKVGSEWQWDTLTHKREYRNGTVIGGTLTMTVNSHVPTIGTYNAGMTLNYDFSGAAVCKGTPLEYSRNNVTQNSPVWNVNNF